MGGGEVGVNTKACWDCWDTMCPVDLLVQSLSNRWQGSDQMFAVELVVRLSWSLEPQVSVSLWFGLVRIRPFRSDLTISEPWDEGARFE